MFVARPAAGAPLRRDLSLVRAVRHTFTGPAGFLADPGHRARVGAYLTDMAGPYGREVPEGLFGEPLSPALGHSYGEMAQVLIEQAVTAAEPVGLLILAFSVHDLWPGRQTAAYLSSVTPGAPMAFAICDQGSAATFTGLRIARDYAASAGIGRALLIVVEQAALPYDCPVATPAEHRGVAMLYSDSDSDSGGDGGDGAGPAAWLAAVRQHPGVPPGDAVGLAAADLAVLAAGHHEVGLVLNDALAGVWAAPAAGRVRVMPPGQPSTAVWWGLIDEIGERAGDAAGPRLVVAADYDPGLRYLCLTAFGTGPRARRPAGTAPGRATAR